jgi:ribosome biogenesis protein BRX1
MSNNKAAQNGAGARKRKRAAAAAAKEKELAAAKVETKVEAEEGPAAKRRELPAFKNKQKVLILCSRGVTHRYRHLMNDMRMLMPHGKAESKMDDKSNLGVINEIADLNNCNDVLFFECRKKEDLYLWVGKTPNGPSAKFLVLNGTAIFIFDFILIFYLILHL